MDWYIAGGIVVVLVWLLINYMLDGMTVTLGRPRYLVRILYKSGNSQDTWFSSFNITRKKDGTIVGTDWKEYEAATCPISVGATEDIEAVYQLEAIVSVWSFFVGKSWFAS